MKFSTVKITKTHTMMSFLLLPWVFFYHWQLLSLIKTELAFSFVLATVVHSSLFQPLITLAILPLLRTYLVCSSIKYTSLTSLSLFSPTSAAFISQTNRLLIEKHFFQFAKPAFLWPRHSIHTCEKLKFV